MGGSGSCVCGGRGEQSQCIAEGKTDVALLLYESKKKVETPKRLRQPRKVTKVTTWTEMSFG